MAITREIYYTTDNTQDISLWTKVTEPEASLSKLISSIPGGTYYVRSRTTDGTNYSKYTTEDSVIVATVFSPADVNPHMWQEARKVDAADTTNEVRDTGTQKFVKQYEDKSVNLRHLIQATDANQPELINPGVDTAHLLFGTQTNRVLTSADINSLITSSFELFFYLDVDDISAVQTLWETGDPGLTNGGIIAYINAQTLNVKFKVKSGDSTYHAQTGVSMFDTVGQKMLINVRFDYEATQIYIAKNGTDQSLPTNTGAMTGLDLTSMAITNGIDFNNREASTISFRGKQRAFLMTPKLTAAQRADVTSYFAY